MINTSFIHTIIKIQGHCHILKTFSVIKENANFFLMKIIVTRHFCVYIAVFFKKIFEDRIFKLPYQYINLKS